LGARPGVVNLITACYRHDLQPYQVLIMTCFDPVLLIHHLNRWSLRLPPHLKISTEKGF